MIFTARSRYTTDPTYCHVRHKNSSLIELCRSVSREANRRQGSHRQGNRAIKGGTKNPVQLFVFLSLSKIFLLIPSVTHAGANVGAIVGVISFSSAYTASTPFVLFSFAGKGTQQQYQKRGCGVVFMRKTGCQACLLCAGSCQASLSLEVAALRA